MRANFASIVGASLVSDDSRSPSQSTWGLPGLSYVTIELERRAGEHPHG